MALSEQEQRMLAEIEKALIAEDPRLAREASGNGSSPSFVVNIQSIALMMLGLLGLIGGIALAQQSLWFVTVSVVGFLIMFAGGLIAFVGKRSDSSVSAGKDGARLDLAGRAGATPQGGAAEGKGGLGDRMEDSFRKRFDR